MKNYLKPIAISFSLLFSITMQVNAQSNSFKSDFLSQDLILSIESGISYGFSDYQSSSIGPVLRGSIEYYPLIIDDMRLGIKTFGGGLKLNFSDTRTLILSNYGLRDDIPPEVTTDAIQFGVGISFGYAISKSIIPSLTIGASYLIFSPKDSDLIVLKYNQQGFYDKNIFLLSLEGSVKIEISERFGINLLLAYYPTSTDYLEDISAINLSNHNDSFLSGLIGLSYAISGNSDADEDGISNENDSCPNTPTGVKVDQFGCPIDSDNDGVPNYLDHCINTPPSIAVDSNGCPIDTDMDGVPDYLDKCLETPANLLVDSMGCPKDYDKDGVPDYLDKCPDTPIEIEVNESGCPVDSDDDGVPDYLDKCPDTPINTEVDSTGCPENSQVNVETFYQFILRGDDTFRTNTDTLIDFAKIILDEIASYIKNQALSKWRIEGYMDNQGSISFLKKLSYNRAKTVFDYLVSKGVLPNQLEVYGLGDSFPIGNNNTIEGRNTNKRILIIRQD